MSGSNEIGGIPVPGGKTPDDGAARKIRALLQRHWPAAATAPVVVAVVGLLAALAAAFISLWLAKLTGVIYGFLRLVDAVLSPTVIAVAIVAGLVVWFVNKYDEGLRSFFREVREIHVGGVKASFGGKSAQAAGAAVDAVTPDSLKEIEKRAQQEDVNAQFHLGLIYANGEGVPQDYAKAKEWYEKAASAGYPDAQNNLGQLYAQGDGVPQDYKKAAELYEQAAKQGLPEGQLNLGLSYHRGQGVHQNYEEAAKWYRLAAPKHATAQNNLGALHRGGQGAPRDIAAAAAMFHDAAKRGSVEAQHNLGVLYSLGEGVPRDFRESYIWFAVAASGGYFASPRMRDKVAGRLSAADLARAQAEAVRRQEDIRRGTAAK